MKLSIGEYRPKHSLSRIAGLNLGSWRLVANPGRTAVIRTLLYFEVPSGLAAYRQIQPGSTKVAGYVEYQVGFRLCERIYVVVPSTHDGHVRRDVPI